MATHSGILPSEIPGTEETGKLQVRGVTRESCTPWQLNNNNKPISTQQCVCVCVCIKQNIYSVYIFVYEIYIHTVYIFVYVQIFTMPDEINGIISNSYT